MMVRTQRKILALLVVAAAVVVVLAPRLGSAQGTPVPAGAPTQAQQLAEGKKIFDTVCLACHQPGAKGIPGIYPPLAGNPLVTLADPTVVISTVLNGRGGMPRFASLFTDEQIAAVLTYIRASFGNHAAPVTAQQVHDVRVADASGGLSTPAAPLGVDAQATVAPNPTPAS